MPKYSGLLVVFEGIDNAGKTTQAQLVAEWLKSKGRQALISREMRTGIGQCFKAELDSGGFSPRVKALLFAADRYHRIETEIMPALKQGTVVLADRWALSSLVYRSIEGQGVALAEFVNKDAIPPDTVIMLDINPDLAYHRGQLAKKPCLYSEVFLRLAQQRYLELAQEEGYVVVDGSNSVEQVTNSIIEHLAPLVEKLK